MSVDIDAELDSLFEKDEETTVDVANVDEDVLELAVLNAEIDDEITAKERAAASKPVKAPSVATPVAKAKSTRSKTGVERKRLERVDGNTAERIMALLDTTEQKLHADIIKNAAALAIKPADKAVNLFGWLKGKCDLSVYTHMALKHMIAQGGDATSKSLAAYYEARPLGKSTALAQTNQIMSLFPALGIAQRNGSALKINEKSEFVVAFGR